MSGGKRLSFWNHDVMKYQLRLNTCINDVDVFFFVFGVGLYEGVGTPNRQLFFQVSTTCTLLSMYRQRQQFVRPFHPCNVDRKPHEMLTCVFCLGIHALPSNCTHETIGIH